MNYLLGSEILLYVGIAIMCVAAVSMVVCVMVFKTTGKKIDNILEQEYGKCLK